MQADWFVAIVPDGTPPDPVAHRRRDLDPDEIVVTSTESAGRTLITITTDLEDPGLAMLAENTWCHVFRERADGTLHHMGQGWIDPLSIQQQDEDLVSLDVMCSPRDWDAAVAAALAPYKSLPGFDPVLVPADKRNDPVEILDGYSKLVMCHPSTHEMTVVDILGVDLPEIEIADPDFPGPQPEAATRMVQRVDVTVTTEWIESRSGQINAGNTIEGEFEEDRASTLTPDAFEAKWPKEGSTINGDSGYTVMRSVLTRREDLDEEDFPRTAGPVRGSSGVYNYVVDPDLISPEPQELMLERVWYDLELDIRYKVAQRRQQVVRFSIVNGAPGAAGGNVQVLDLKTEDITIDDTTPPWQSDTDYEEHDVVRVGSRNCAASATITRSATSARTCGIRSVAGSVTVSNGRRWRRTRARPAPRTRSPTSTPTEAGRPSGPPP